MSPAAAFFEDIWVVVNKGVYEPAEDTFLLCQHLDIVPGEHMLELGTGCGLVAIVAAKQGARVIATDQSLLAVQNAQENVIHHNLQEVIEVRLGQLFEPIRHNERFSLIAFNPPYLPGSRQDPAFDSAWSGGPNGRTVIDAFLIKCTQFLEADGRVLLVQSSLSNPDKTKQMLAKLFHEQCVKAEKPFFYEQLLLFEACRPQFIDTH